MPTPPNPKKYSSNTGRYVAEACEAEQVVKLLDGFESRLIATLHAYDDKIYKGDYLSDVLFSPDERYLVTVCNCSTCRVWDCNDGTLLSSPEAHGWINKVVFAEDGHTLKIEGDGERGPCGYDFQAEYDSLTASLLSCSCDRCFTGNL